MTYVYVRAIAGQFSFFVFLLTSQHNRQESWLLAAFNATASLFQSHWVDIKMSFRVSKMRQATSSRVGASLGKIVSL